MKKSELRTGVLYACDLRPDADEDERFTPVQVLDDRHTYSYNWHSVRVGAVIPSWKRDEEWTVSRPPGPFPHGVLGRCPGRR